MPTITLTGISGKSYTFHVFEGSVTWHPYPGLYAFADSQGVPRYIGQTEDFTDRNPGSSHSHWSKASIHGARLILAMVYQGGEAARKAAEADLIRAYNPPANTQLRTGAQILTGQSGLGFAGRPRTILNGK